MTDTSYMHDSGEYKSVSFTVKKNSGPSSSVTKESYAPVLEHFNRYAIVQPPYYEHDSSGRLHMHGILSVKKGFYKRRLQVPGFYVYTTDCVHIEQWLEYCKKCDPDYLLVKKLKMERHELDNTEYMF